MELRTDLYSRLQDVAGAHVAFADENIADLIDELEEEYSGLYETYWQADDAEDDEATEDWLLSIDNLLSELTLWQAAQNIERRLKLEASCKVLIGLLSQES